METTHTPLLRSIPDTQADLGRVGRTKVYELIKNGNLEAVNIGRRSFVTTTSIEAYVRRLAGSTTTPDRPAA